MIWYATPRNSESNLFFACLLLRLPHCLLATGAKAPALAALKLIGTFEHLLHVQEVLFFPSVGRADRQRIAHGPNAGVVAFKLLKTVLEMTGLLDLF
jgi:hypothetical protein